MMTVGERFTHLLRVFVVLLVLYLNPAASALNSSTIIRCIEKEREALLLFKQGLVEDYGRLSSWGSTEDCCKWSGIKCSNRTNHVIMVDLHLEYSFNSYEPLRGKISPSLFELQHLKYLNLNSNNLNGTIPHQLGNLTNLQHLDLGSNDFNGIIPHQLGNLTNLQHLDLGRNHDLITVNGNLEWLSHLSSLKFLDMSRVNLSKAINWLQAINMLPSLSELHLSVCELSDVVPQPSSLSFVNSSTSLAILDLSDNHLSSSIFHLLFNFSVTLVHVDLYGNHLQGPIPANAFHNMKSLAYLSLSQNELEGRLPKSFGNLCSLHSLDLSVNNFSEELPTFVQNMSGCIENSLEELRLSNNLLSGSLPDMKRFSTLRELYLSQNQLTGFSNKKFGLPSALFVLLLEGNQIGGSLPDLTDMSSLTYLFLAKNQLNGTLPKSMGQLSKLEYLDVSYNSLEGNIFEPHLSNLSKLKYLDLSFNSLSFNLSSHWVPPFQLDEIRLSSCKLGPHFPKWLRTQTNFSFIDISNNGISESIPMWFWDLSPKLNYLNLSCNKINGTLPNLSLKFSDFPGLDLSSNHLDGPLPLFPSNLTSLDLSNNRFSGPISSLCAISGRTLTFIDLSNNLLSGRLLDCWTQYFQQLSIMNLANNNLTGKIPNSIGSIYQIETLHLRNNSFFGELPLSLKNCTRLRVLDMGENKLSGKIPAWIGESLSQLIVLSLRSNEFNGNIPKHLCHLTHIQIFDLSRNNISGTIPECLNNFTAMSQEGNSSDIFYTYTYGQLYDDRHGGPLYYHEYADNALILWKGLEHEYTRNLGLLKIIDLSSNKLVGEIPGKIANLIELGALNLSRNNLTGQITPMIGQLKMLDSLDLSQNQLFGEIPASLSNLDFLGVLNLSNNNLSGKIPVSRHLQTFDASSYMRNPDLCGPPLPKKCPGDETALDPPFTGGNEDPNTQEKEDGVITPGFFVSMALGFIIGFWGVCSSLFLINSWRHAYFHFLNKIRDWLYVIIAVNVAKLQRRLRG